MSRDKLHAFVGLVLRWSSKINLVSVASADDMWRRHVLDSAQLFHVKRNPGTHLVDLGSGGGFPGVVLAILARSKHPDTRITLVESDQRKATFLRTARRELGLTFDVLDRRIEDIEALGATTLTARALTDLSGLIKHAHRHLDPNGTALFPKGRLWQTEFDDACQNWSFDVKVHPSQTSKDSRIFEVGNIAGA